VWARFTAVEIARKRLVQMAVAGAVLYGGLLWWVLGQVSFQTGPVGIVNGTALAQASALGIAFFINYGLIALFAAFATAGALSADRDLLALVVRPVSRRAMVWGRFYGYGGATVLYATLVYGVVILAIGVRFGLPATALELMAGWGFFALEGLAMAALALLGSLWLSPMANGIAVLGLYFLVFLAGSIGQLAHIASSLFGASNAAAFAYTSAVANLVLPTDAAYRWALFEAMGSIRTTIPLALLGPIGAGSVTSPLIAVYGVLYVAGVVWLAERGWRRHDLH
jgi:ABC-type transport system involved in multi-copper enzyme maturation permease subunit